MKIKLTQDKYALVDDEDYKRINVFKWYFSNGSYAVRNIKKDGKRTLTQMHRAIMNCNTQVDHINRNTIDNRKENLRFCNSIQNQGNRKISKRNTSGIRGVYFCKVNKNWVARIIKKRKTINLGRYPNKNDAKDAYDKAAKEYFGEFYRETL